MKIKINEPTETGINFAHEYLNQERDEIPYVGSLHKVVDSKFLTDLKNGNLDNNDYDIELHPFKWKHYLVIKRYNDMYMSNPKHKMMMELGMGPNYYTQYRKKSSLHVPYKNGTPRGGKKRTVRRVRRTHRRTHRHRA